jgi:uncharacterized protein involved in response to NO
VTVIAVLITLQGLVAIGAGIAVIIERENGWLHDHVHASNRELVAYAVAMIFWGVLALIVGRSLRHGRNWARLLVAALEILAVASGVFLLAKHRGSTSDAIVDIAVGAIVLLILFMPGANAFFRGRRA